MVGLEIAHTGTKCMRRLLARRCSKLSATRDHNSWAESLFRSFRSNETNESVLYTFGYLGKEEPSTTANGQERRKERTTPCPKRPEDARPVDHPNQSEPPPIHYFLCVLV
jgi:hypothetical protein